ncbi:hypothetical protein NUSPORA_02186 [Nucleospora cyclopteri]
MYEDNGFLLTVVMGKEIKAFEEFCAYFNTFLLKNMAIQQSDIKKQFYFEVDLLKTNVFTVLEKYNSCILLKTNKKFQADVLNMFKSDLLFKNCAFNFIYGAYPLEIIRKIKKIEDLEFIKLYLSSNKDMIENTTFKISYKNRCSQSKKEEIFRIALKYFQNSKVDLENPKIIFSVQEFKSYIGVFITEKEFQCLHKRTAMT